jgi:hypothetical protein
LLVYDTIVRGQQSISDRIANAKVPLYEIEHVCPIAPDQQQSIANAIVKIHSEMFTTPSLFVNVRFKDTNALPLFVAGQRVSNTATTKTRYHSFTLLYPSIFLHKDLRPPFLQAEVRSYCVTGLTLSLAIQRTVNYILAHVRHGPSRTQEHYNSVCASIASAWASIIGTTPELELRGIFILGDIVAGWEAGFQLEAVSVNVQEWYWKLSEEDRGYL